MKTKKIRILKINTWNHSISIHKVLSQLVSKQLFSLTIQPYIFNILQILINKIIEKQIPGTKIKQETIPKT